MRREVRCKTCRTCVCPRCRQRCVHISGQDACTQKGVHVAWCACVQKSAGGGPEEQHQRGSSDEHSERGRQPRSWKQGATSSASSELPVCPAHDDQSLGHSRQTQIQPQGNVPYRFKKTHLVHSLLHRELGGISNFFALIFFLELVQNTIRSSQIACRDILLISFGFMSLDEQRRNI